MKKSDTERIKKIVSTWDALKRQIDEHLITKEKLLNDEFSQWAVTTPLYNIGEQVYKTKNNILKLFGALCRVCVTALFTIMRA